MTTLAWVFILGAIVIGSAVLRGRASHLAEDLSDAFLALATGQTDKLTEVFSRKGDATGTGVTATPASGGSVVSNPKDQRPPYGYAAMTAWINSKGFHFHPTKGQTTGGTHAPNSYHYKGEAVDLSGSAADMLKAAKTIEAAFGPYITELIHTPLGYSIKHGKKVKPIDAAAHYNHVHWAEATKDFPSVKTEG